jgi:toxin-antitoxin system PIN domain toxin
VTVLLDANVLIALLVEDHVHHGAAENWFVGLSGNFATCPVTQGSLIRLLIREGQPAGAAREILSGTTADLRHEFWPDDVPYTDVPAQGMIGHRQVADAYLAQLARAHRSRLATFDQAMAKLHHDVAELVPDGRPALRDPG